VLVVWFTWGGLRDIRNLFRKLEKVKVNPNDDGMVVEHNSADVAPAMAKDETRITKE